MQYRVKETVIKNHEPKYTAEARSEGLTGWFIGWVAFSGNKSGLPYEFDTFKEAKNQITRWKNIDEKKENYIYIK